MTVCSWQDVKYLKSHDWLIGFEFWQSDSLILPGQINPSYWHNFNRILLDYIVLLISGVVINVNHTLRFGGVRLGVCICKHDCWKHGGSQCNLKESQLLQIVSHFVQLQTCVCVCLCVWVISLIPTPLTVLTEKKWWLNLYLTSQSHSQAIDSWGCCFFLFLFSLLWQAGRGDSDSVSNHPLPVDWFFFLFFSLSVMTGRKWW